MTKDENEEDWERHGNPDDVRRRVDTFPHDEVDDDPDGNSSEVHFPAEDGGVSDHVLSVQIGTIFVDSLDDVTVEHSVKRKAKSVKIILNP